MAKNCCVCGSKISIMDYAYELSSKYSQYKICYQCHTKSYNIIYDGTVEKIKDAQTYFIPFLQSSEIEPTVRTAINDMLEEGYKKAQRKEEEVTYKEEYKHLLNEAIEKKEIGYAKLVANLKEFMDNSLMTSGYNFEGYKIVAYHGVISGEVVLGTGFLSEISAGLSDFFGTESGEFANKLKEAKEAAKVKLMEEAISVGGNAIIGIDFDYVVFGSNIIGVCANGTAVEVEEIYD